MKSVRITAVLFEYDGPQVLEARDRIGGHYIVVTLKPVEDKQKYLVVGTTPEQLWRFRGGLLDLRTLLVDSSHDEWYLAWSNNLENPLAIELQRENTIDEAFLPDSDFFLHNYPAEDDVLAEAKSRNNLVIQIKAEPPEAVDAHRIKVNTLVGLLGLIQSLVSHTYRAALVNSGVRQLNNVSIESHLDVVVPAATGSFKVLLESSASPDLLGPNTNLAFALRTIDMLFMNAVSPEDALSTIRNYRGHVAGSYLKLLQFLEKHETGLRYVWAEPSSISSHSSGVSLGNAKSLVKALAKVKNLSSENVSIIGEIDRVNRRQKTWGLLTEEGIVSGNVLDDGPNLNGLEIGARYAFECLEEIEEVSVSGWETRKLYLKKFTPIN